MVKYIYPMLKAMLSEEKFIMEGIFSKEMQYMKRYDITEEQMERIKNHLRCALQIDEIKMADETIINNIN